MFMQYVRALEESNSKYFLYENNNSIHKNIKDEISKFLGVEPIMINSLPWYLRSNEKDVIGQTFPISHSRRIRKFI